MLVPHTIEVDEDFIVKFYQHGADETTEYRLVLQCGPLTSHLTFRATEVRRKKTLIFRGTFRHDRLDHLDSLLHDRTRHGFRDIYVRGYSNLRNPSIGFHSNLEVV